MMRSRQTTKEQGTEARRTHRPQGRADIRRRSSESGYAYIIAMALIVATIIGSQVVLENLITQARRQREQETIWRGNQWARAIRLYYHKTGHYPQTIDDLETGVPDVHFLRASAIKDPMDPDDGSWRFIYVNSTGQIIGSVRYATLQQMALLDLNNGQIPGTQPSTIPGSVSAASLSSISTDNSNNSDNGNSAASGDNSGTPNSGGQNAGGTNGTSSPGGTSSPASSAPSGSTDNSAAGSPSQNSNLSEMPSFGQGQPASTFGSPEAGTQNATALAQLTQLKPTGPVDGPVPGAFLTGVGIPTAIDQNSIKIYHQGKKYKDWEFIWNPLEDQAQALQQGLGAAQGQATQPGQSTGSSVFGANPFGASTGAGAPGSTSPQSSSPQPNQ